MTHGDAPRGRFILLGISFKSRVIVVCHCSRENENVIRLISARKADRGEEQEYWRRKR
ncbi:MAG TPA: BrnT family toxin [Candidatus Binatia bacterium]|nr:BrnT family toxin [Candidatus Binatia bacterium]